MSALLYYYLATSCKTNLQSCMLHKCLWCLHFPPRFWRGKVCSQYEVSSCHTVLRTHTGKSPSCLFLNVSMTVIDMCTHTSAFVSHRVKMMAGFVFTFQNFPVGNAEG